MQKCLGIYIENNLIKYAKVSKERDKTTVESFGIRFFQNLSEELKKVVEETYSFNTPISINLANEKYLYFDIFALLNKRDVERTVQTEFENFCEEKKYNRNAFEMKYALMPNKDDAEKIRALNVFINTIELNSQMEPLEKFRLTKVMPISIAIGNIARLNKKENQLIVNMEETTTVTTIYENQIYNVDTIEIGSKEVLESINKLENSYSKAYEICKNTTIYTAESEDLGEEQPYLQYIMPTVFKIAEEVQNIVKNQTGKIHTIYLTGTLASINNIDLYFQEFFPDIDCKILKPNLIDETVTKINIKEYVEVNSAIALATAGLDEGIQELNFRKAKTGDKLAKLLTVELPNGKEIKLGKGNISTDLSGKLDAGEAWMVRAIAAILLIIIIYCVFSKLLSNMMIEKENEINNLIASEKMQISNIETDITSLDSKSEKYEKLIAELKRAHEKISDIAARRNSIPNLLNQIMYRIPEQVQVISIKNSRDKIIEINATSNDYDQLGYFISVIKTQKILKNVVSSSGVKSDGMITVTIEGELP